MTKKTIIGIVIAIIVICIALSIYYISILHKSTISKSTSLRIFCSGSLAIPFQNISQIFENMYHIPVHIESSGSVMAVRKIVDLHRWCDVLGVSDYRLIPRFMIPKYAKWCIGFATNQIVLAFTNHSKYAKYLLSHPQDWYKILMRSDVRYGFSNPNMDPCGYRAVGVIALAALYYHNLTILEKLVISKISGSRYVYKNGTITVYIPATFNVKGRNLVIRPKEIDLVALLESGEIDYAFEYKSVAIQHHLLYITLPPSLNLGNVDYSNFYKKVTVVILWGTKEAKAIKMAPIVYGITIPTVSKHRDLAIKFVELILSDVGRKIFERYGQNILRRLIIIGNIPKDLIKFLRENGYTYVIKNITG